MVSGRCVRTESAPCCSIRPIRPPCSACCAGRCSPRTRPNATAMFPTSSIPVGRCCTATRLCCRTVAAIRRSVSRSSSCRRCWTICVTEVGSVLGGGRLVLRITFRDRNRLRRHQMWCPILGYSEGMGRQMRTSRGIRPALLITTGAVLAGLATACGTGGHGHQTASHQSVAPIGASSSSASSTAPTATTPASSTAPTTANSQSTSAIKTTPKTPECKSADLTLSLGSGEGGGAGSFYPAIQFTNSSKSNCVIVGFPGVSYVAGDNGHQVGAPATRDGNIGAQITLAPGQVASAIVREVNPQNFPTATCKPVAVRGFRVYPPDETAAMFLPFQNATTGCSTNISQLCA